MAHRAAPIPGTDRGASSLRGWRQQSAHALPLRQLPGWLATGIRQQRARMVSHL